MKPYNSNIKYDDINFFDNDFDYAEFMEASLSKNSNIIQDISSLKTPNNTTDGMLKKAWIIEDGVRYLLKGGYKNETIQPFDEIIKVVKNIKRIEVSKLEDIPEWFDNLLHEYQDITGYSDNRINKLCILLNRQIEKIEEMIKNSYFFTKV